MHLGIDIGTSAAKAVVIDEGRIIGVGSGEYPISQPREGWSEQDPADWWRGAVAATRAACRDLDPRAMKGVALSGQMHGLVLLDREAIYKAGTGLLQPLRPAILWNDQRTQQQCDAIEKALGGRAACVRAVGNAALPGFTLPKMLWVRDNEPEVWSRVAGIFLPKDYIRFLMTAETVSDFGDASGLLMLDPATRRWSDAISAAFEIDRRFLPQLRESAAICGDLGVWAADQLGLARSTPVICGSGDNQCGAIGAGVVAPGDALLSLGTSGVLYVHSDTPRLDAPEAGPVGRLHSFCAADGKSGQPGGWCNTGCMLSAAGSLAWARSVLAHNQPFDSLVAEAATAPAGCDGLIFLPHLTGERCPHPNPNARAGWIGLTSRHTRAHMLRAVLEGVAMTMRQIFDLLRGLGLTVNSARIGGGGAKSTFWRQMHADALDIPITSLQTEEGPAVGAALLAGVGCGAWSDIREACAAAIHHRETLNPDPAAARRYAETLQRFKDVYPALVPYFRTAGG
ncbi:xylulokinase [Phycisphaerales bacterium]|nr:xylulokinase [Phycisphaerales bacterium]